ncbi:hypothetical protein [Actinoplanes sp. NPDC026623]|uniref:hypothetical protein n=1 Tax=Actinoplanes sp. NPDC026623 TaxID=3155610 RepID=UPI0033C61E1F
MTSRIPLTNSDQFALVDDDMYDELSKWEWYALPVGNTYYAARDVVDEDGNRTVMLMHSQIMYPREPHRWGAFRIGPRERPLRIVRQPKGLVLYTEDASNVEPDGS